MDNMTNKSREARTPPAPLNLSRANQIVDNWPEWKRSMADKILRPSPPGAPQSVLTQARSSPQTEC